MEPLATLASVPPGSVEPLLARLTALEATQHRLEQERQALAAANHVLTLRVRLLEAELQARAAAREARTVDPEVLSLFADGPDDPPVAIAASDPTGTVRPPSRRRTADPTGRSRRARAPRD